MDKQLCNSLVKQVAGTSRRQVLGRGLVVGAASLFGWQDSQARDPKPRRTSRKRAARTEAVLPSQANAFGRSLGEWLAAWSPWDLANPGAATTCEQGQAGKVWFLPGLPTNVDPPILDVACTVPTGTAILVPLLVGANTSAETCEAGVADTLASVEGITALSLTVDGEVIPDLSRYHVEATPYEFEEEVSVACGYTLLLTPLPPGEHTIQFTVAGTPVSLTWHVTVVPRGQLQRGA